MNSDTAQTGFDIITLGDSTIDTFIKIHDASVECDINHEECKICVSYGEKIPVDEIGHSVAGNAANVAVGCAKAGLKSAIYTNIGQDPSSQLIKKTLTREGVFSDYIVVNKDLGSNFSVVLTFQGERTIFVYHRPWSYCLPPLQETRWLYLTSMAESFLNSNIMDEVCHYLEKSHAKLAFSPGTYQLKADVKRFPRILERCQVLFVNLEEAKTILGIDHQDTVEVDDLLSRLLLLGPKLIVITDGAEGSYACDGNKKLKAPIFPVQVVEKTGAGDAYSSGFISALNWDQPLKEAMIWGAINASNTIKKLGPQAGLLSREEIEKIRKAIPDIVASEF